jgi:hypothetical protein
MNAPDWIEHVPNCSFFVRNDSGGLNLMPGLSAVLTCSLYWMAQLGSLAFPGTALIDPEFRDRPGSRAPRQPLLASILLALLATAWIVG